MLCRHVLLATGAILLLAGCASPASPFAESGPPSLARSPSAIANSVTGSARIDLTAWGLPPEIYHLNVRKNGDGQVHGMISIELSDPIASLEIEPYCLQVDGHLAWIEGHVTTSNNAVLPVGTTIFFRIRDNGQGANAQPDAVSFIFFGDFVAGRCEARFGTGTPWSLHAGNIQVR